jgi:hypothetical protein
MFIFVKKKGKFSEIFLHSRIQNKNKFYCIGGGGVHAMVQLVEALRYKPEGRGFDSRWCH